MLGIVIGVLWYVFSVIVGGAAVETTILSIVGFLWYWYLVWGCLILCIPVIIALFGMVVGTAGGCTGDGKAFLAGGLFGIIGVIVGVIFSVSTVLYLTACWLVLHAGDAATPIADWDTQRIIAAGICAFLAFLVGRVAALSSKSASSS